MFPLRDQVLCTRRMLQKYTSSKDLSSKFQIISNKTKKARILATGHTVVHSIPSYQQLRKLTNWTNNYERLTANMQCSTYQKNMIEMALAVSRGFFLCSVFPTNSIVEKSTNYVKSRSVKISLDFRARSHSHGHVRHGTNIRSERIHRGIWSLPSVRKCSMDGPIKYIRAHIF